MNLKNKWLQTNITNYVNRALLLTVLLILIIGMFSIPAYAKTSVKTNVEWLENGNQFFERGDYTSAIEAYNMAIAINPDYAAAWYNKGNALYHLERYEDAIKAYDKTIAIDPDYGAAWNNKGVALGKLGRYEEARNAWIVVGKGKPGQVVPELDPITKPPNYLFMAVVGGIIGCVLLILVFRNKSKPSVSQDLNGEQKRNTVETPLFKKSSFAPEIASAFGYKGATIQYKVKVENPTSEPMADIKVNLYVPDVFLASESTKSIAMLKPSESKTVTFEIRPTGECGDCEVSGKVVYYDYATKKTTEIEIPAKSLSIVCPLLKGKEISKPEWHGVINNLVKAEESTKDIDMPAKTLFEMASRIVKDMNMHQLEPEMTDSPQLFNGVARFYGVGVKGLKYAAQVEVVGGAKKSRLILKTWAEKEEALTGFYHGLLDEIEKRVHVKGYIDNSIVQHFYHYGDNIGTQVKDSIVQRSNIGAGAGDKKCSNCNTMVDASSEFCNKCGEKLNL